MSADLPSVPELGPSPGDLSFLFVRVLVGTKMLQDFEPWCPNPTTMKAEGHLCFKKDFIYLFLERGEGRENKRERNIGVRGKHWSVASCMRLVWGPNLQPRHVP